MLKGNYSVVTSYDVGVFDSNGNFGAVLKPDISYLISNKYYSGPGPCPRSLFLSSREVSSVNSICPVASTCTQPRPGLDPSLSSWPLHPSFHLHIPQGSGTQWVQMDLPQSPPLPVLPSRKEGLPLIRNYRSRWETGNGERRKQNVQNAYITQIMVY